MSQGNGKANPPSKTTQLADQLPPHNLDAERCLLGGILLDNEILKDIEQILSPDDFYRDAHQVIYAAMRQLQNTGKGIDAVTLADELTRHEQFKQIGGDDMLLAIANSVPHAANARYHAELVAQKATARRTAEAANQTIRDVYSNLFTPQEIHERATNRLASIEPSPNEEKPWPELTLNQPPEAPPFPVHVLPEPIQRYCKAVAAVTSTATDIPGAAILATASAAIGQSCNIHLRRTHQESPLLYILLVADPGKSKTPGIKLVVRPLVMIDRRLREESKLDRQAWEEAKKVAGRTNNGDPPPPQKRAIVKDITRETLVAILASNPRGVLANPDEATAWVGSFNEYKSRGTDRQFWLDIWSSTPHSTDREGGNRSFYVHAPLVTVVAGIPPEMLSSLTEQQGRNDGFRDRLLFVMPTNFPPRRWIEDELDQGDETTWCYVIEKLQSQDMVWDNHKNLLRPSQVDLTPTAKAAWIQWYDKHCEQMENPDGPDWAPGVYSKMVSYCARFALILSRLRIAMDPEASTELVSKPVAENDVKGAIELVNYFTAHFATVEHQMTGGTGNRDAQAILSWIRRKGFQDFREATLREDLRRRFPDIQALENPLQVLIHAGAIRTKIEHTATTKRGRRPSRTFEINPALKAAPKTPWGAPEITVITENSPEGPL